MRVRHPDAWLGLAIVLLAAALRLPSLTLNSLWLDELFTAEMLSRPLAQQARIYWNDVHPPLFNALAFLWSRVFGSSELALRLLPALTGIAGAGAMFAALRRALGRTAAASAGLFTAFLPGHVYHSQDLRSYALAFLLCIFVAYWLLRYLDRPERRARWGLAGFCALLFGTHYVGLFVAAAAHLAALFGLEGSWRRRGLRVAGLGACTALLMAPFVPQLVHRRAATDTYWPGAPNWGVLLDTLQYLFRPRDPAPLDGTLSLVFLGLLILAVWWRGRGDDPRLRARANALLTLAWFPLFAVAAVSVVQPRFSILIPRVVLVFAAPLVALAGLGAAVLGRGLARWMRAPLAAAIPAAMVAGVALTQLGVARYYVEPFKDDCRGVLRQVARLQDEEVTFLHIGPQQMAWRLGYYVRRLGIHKPFYLTPPRFRQVEADVFVETFLERRDVVDLVLFGCGSNAWNVKKAADAALEPVSVWGGRGQELLVRYRRPRADSSESGSARDAPSRSR